MFQTLDLRPLAASLALFLTGGSDKPAPASSPAQEVAVKLAGELEKSYVFEDKGHAMAAALRSKAESGAWNSLEGDALARALTQECQAITHDKHLNVGHESAGRGQGLHTQNPRDAAAEKRDTLQRNNGFERAERLQGNVGYLEVRGFPQADLFTPTAAAAMAFLQNTDALVIDLRRNGGGEPEAVRYLCSWFFGAEPVHLNTLVNRERKTSDEYWTLRELPGPRYLDKPVFVLTGSHTFSAAEECAYNLQSLKRATIVGQTSGGGAHPVSRRDLGQGFSVMLPVARAENPVTKTNWEGVGVKPDVEVAEDAALEQAWALALDALAAREKDGERRKQLEELAAEKRGKSPR
jgi:hypothetical protein